MASSTIVSVGVSLDQHRAVTFFQSLPRASTADTNFAESADYFFSLATAAAIPGGIGVFFILALLLFTLVRFTCARDSIDEKTRTRKTKSPKENIKHLVLSSILVHVSLGALSVAMLGSIVLTESTLNVVSTGDGLLKALQRTGLTLIDFISWIRTRFGEFDPASLGGGEFLELAFQTLKDYIPGRFPEMAPLRQNLAGILNTIVRIGEDVARAVVLVFTFIVIVFLIQLLAILFAFWNDSLSKRHRGCRVTLYTLYILVPLLISWIFLAVWTGVGIGLSDACVMLHDYRDVLRGDAEPEDFNNTLVDTGLLCPINDSSDGLQNQIQNVTGAVLDNPLAGDTLTLLLGISSGQLEQTVTWTADEVTRWVDCTILAQFSGNLEYQTCGAVETSIISGVQYLWFGFLLLCITLTTMIFAMMLGSFVTWTSLVYPASVCGHHSAAALAREMSKTSVSDVESGDTDSQAESPVSKAVAPDSSHM